MDAAKSARPRAGLWALVIKMGLKFGGKLLSVLLKLAKGLKVGKLGLAAASFGAYAVLFSWQFALVLIASLVIHEMGHLWAMRRYGMKTRGLYLIPLLGAAAVADDAFPSRKAESVIALMGPCWGLLMALAAAGVYAATGSPLVAAIAGWMAMLNLFNLLPINPLDGGRLMKSVAYSVSSTAGYVFLALGLVGAFIAAFHFGLALFTLLLVIGVLDLFGERGRMRKERDKRAVIDALASALGVPAEGYAITQAIVQRHRALLDGHTAMFPSKLLDGNPYTGRFSPQEWAGHFRTRLMQVACAACRDYPRLFGLMKGRIRPTDPRSLHLNPDNEGRLDESASLFAYVTASDVMPSMTGRQTALAFAAYVALAAALAALMFAMAHQPAANAALQVFMS